MKITLASVVVRDGGRIEVGRLKLDMNEDNGLDMKDVTVKEIGCGGLSERY